jgi:hypothetical protein
MCFFSFPCGNVDPDLMIVIVCIKLLATRGIDDLIPGTLNAFLLYYNDLKHVQVSAGGPLFDSLGSKYM